MVQCSMKLVHCTKCRVARRIAMLALASVACMVPDTDTKNRCRDTDDCLDDRLCSRGVCVQPQEACSVLCLEVCESSSPCDGEASTDCAAACSQPVGALAELPDDPQTCAVAQVEDWVSECDDTGSTSCDARCTRFCEQSRECSSSLVPDRCETRCLEFLDPCSVDDDPSCEAIDPVLVCLEKRINFGASYDCERPVCRDHLDCDATQDCVHARCFARCSTGDECESRWCVQDQFCSAVVGTACDPSGDVLGDCGSVGACLEVDYRGQNVPGYCSAPCDANVACPEGFRCRGGQCHRCAEGEICPCPFVDDAECDEPEGTGLCAEGTDPLDCSSSGE